MHHIPRQLHQELLSMSNVYPVVTLTGPRQSGKTALVKKCFPEKAYINLEDPEQREKVQFDPKAALTQHPEGVIFDEIQRFPKLMSYIQVHVDAHQQNGMFILTGSHQLMLHQAIAQSLAGRTALLQLLPLSLAEIRSHAMLSIDEQLLKGFYPRLYQQPLPPKKFYRDYMQTYVERDVRLLINLKDLHLFQHFLKLCAGRVGQLINLDSIANELGVSGHTVKHWLSILEASFIIVRLQPYHENIGKRLTKSPKLYFVDPGLAAYLLGIETPEQLSRDPARGHLFENMVILELIKSQLNQGDLPSVYFFRDHQNHEVDALVTQGRTLIPVEIKSSQTFNKSFLKGLDFFKSLFGDTRVPQSYLVYNGGQQTLGHTHLTPYALCGHITSR